MLTISKYRDLLCYLDGQITELVKNFCRSNTYGYCSNKQRFVRLVRIKKLLEYSFNLKEYKNFFYSCTEVNGVQTTKQFNKLVGNKAELIVKTITKTTNTTNKFRFILPAMPHVDGFYIYGLWINCKLETLDDINKVLAILESLNYLGFYNFQYDSGSNEIYSTTSYVYTETFSYEYVYFDVANTVLCVNTKQILKLIENV